MRAKSTTDRSGEVKKLHVSVIDCGLSERFHFGEVGAARLSVLVEEPRYQFGGPSGEMNFENDTLAARMDGPLKGAASDL